MKTVKIVELRSWRAPLAAEDREVYNTPVNHPMQAVACLRTLLPPDLDQERVACVAFDVQKKAMAVWEAGRGSIESVAVDLREVLAPAVMLKASGIILAHNHPSGNIKPSMDDLALTARLAKACKIIDITLMDHLIFTADNFVTLREQNSTLFV